MNTFFKKSVLALIYIGGIFLISLFIMKSCKPIPTEPIITHKTDTVWVTTERTIPMYVPKWKTKIVYKDNNVPIPVDVDTLAILRDYYQQYQFIDTLNIDSIGFVIVTDTISENTIQNRSVFYKYQIPIIYDSTTITNTQPPRRQLYVGGGIASTHGDLLNIKEVGVIYKDKRDILYGLHMGNVTLNGDNSGYVKATVYFKLKLKK